MVQNGNQIFFIRDDILFHRAKEQGIRVEHFCLHLHRIETFLKSAHDIPASGHLAVGKINAGIALQFYMFLKQLQHVKQYCYSGKVYQLHARERRTDLVSIKSVEYRAS
jgi:hypothetical protein